MQGGTLMRSWWYAVMPSQSRQNILVGTSVFHRTSAAVNHPSGAALSAWIDRIDCSYSENDSSVLARVYTCVHAVDLSI